MVQGKNKKEIRDLKRGMKSDENKKQQEEKEKAEQKKRKKRAPN